MIEGPPAQLRVHELLFGWFIDRTIGSDEADLSFRIHPDDGGVRLIVEQDGAREEQRLATGDRAFGFIYARILDQVTRRDTDLVCIHAAALARDGCGIAVAAPSCHGKSTLSLALAARGFTFLSDEVAPIRKTTLELLPFPMAIGCRPGTQDLLKGTPFEHHAFATHEYTGKRLIDPATGALEPVPIRAVILLEPEDEETRASRSYRLFLDPPHPDVAPKIGTIRGVAAASADGEGESVTLEVASGAWVAPAVEALLRYEGVMVTAVEDLDAPAPKFECDPVLTRLPTSEGVLAMLRHLRGFAAIQELARSGSGGFGGLVISLAEAFRSVGFYRLTPGRLPALVEAIESVVERVGTTGPDR